MYLLPLTVRPRPRSGRSPAARLGRGWAWALALVVPASTTVAWASPQPGLRASLDPEAAPGLQDPQLPRSSHPDSSDLNGRARDAQARFERIRRRHLPTTLGWGGGPCDDTVGRMCWRHDTGSIWFPEDEGTAVEEAREELLAVLDEVGSAIPGDAWVLGQRVHYLGEAGRWHEAEAVARRCGPSEGWWCDALLGLALHSLGRYPEAEDAFERSLDAMDPGEARRWRDPEVLLDGEARDVLGRAREAGEDRLLEVRGLMWGLADPLLIVEGNDRLTEHFARHAAVRIREDARNPHAIGWGRDLAELLLRYGWDVGWEKIPGRTADLAARESVVGHEHPDSRSFMPPGEVLASPSAFEDAAWTPSIRYAPSAYAPLSAPVLLPMDGRVSVLPRGDRALVIAPYRLPPDTTLATRQGERPGFEPLEVFAGRGARAGLFATPVDGGRILARRHEGDTLGVLWLEVPEGRYWLSVEVWHPSSGRAGRSRRGIDIVARPADLLALSDLLLLGPGAEAATLEEALRRVRVDDRVESGGTLAVAWEVTGLGFREEVLAYRLEMVAPDGNFIVRAGRWLGLVDRDPPNTLEWSESGPEAPGPVFRSVTMRIPPVDPGVYTIRLELATEGRSTLAVERRVEVVGPPR